VLGATIARPEVCWAHKSLAPSSLIVYSSSSSIDSRLDSVTCAALAAVEGAERRD
jgi:hypothetical protein